MSTPDTRTFLCNIASSIQYLADRGEFDGYETLGLITKPRWTDATELEQAHYVVNGRVLQVTVEDIGTHVHTLNQHFDCEVCGFHDDAAEDEADGEPDDAEAPELDPAVAEALQKALLEDPETIDWTATPLLPVVVDDLDLAFPARGVELTPPAEVVPDGVPESWERFVSDVFMGLARDLQMVPADGIDPGAAWKHLDVVLGCFGTKHQDKIAGAAWLASLWFDAVIWDRAELGGTLNPGEPTPPTAQRRAGNDLICAVLRSGIRHDNEDGTKPVHLDMFVDLLGHLESDIEAGLAEVEWDKLGDGSINFHSQGNTQPAAEAHTFAQQASLYVIADGADPASVIVRLDDHPVVDFAINETTGRVDIIVMADPADA